ncbi:MAG: hypothetical protein JSU67_11155 [Gammaproteobacteria bacterium]|nr:MAG: hypothetical protein JSU67_11155 [Gammaproteobacteria bacterium]
MRAVVFAGPSISRNEVEAFPGVEWRPPVSQGDVYRVARTAPDFIAIIDGYFEGVPSVWHKEILWAMSSGIHVLGASSMGALRAAELHQFGMRGVGEIFENFRDGKLEDDDEVAVLHGPAELGYPLLSLAMVNARKSITAAIEASIITQPVGASLLAQAKSIFYQERQWPRVFELAQESGISAGELAAFESWLERNEQDLKLEDARAMLAELGELMETTPGPFHCDYSFSWTVMWDSVVSGDTGQSPVEADAERIDIESLVVDELRLNPQHYRQIILRARLKQLARREAGRAGIETDETQTRKQLQKLRESLALYTHAELSTWIEQNDWDSSHLQQALELEQQCKTVVDKMGEIDNRILLDELRFDGSYAALKTQAEARRKVDLSSFDGTDIKPPQLLAWYFESQLDESIPPDLDEYLSATGFSDRAEFYRLLEYHYLTTLAIEDEKQ